MRGVRPGPMEGVVAADPFLARTGYNRNREHRRRRMRRGEAANRFLTAVAPNRAAAPCCWTLDDWTLGDKLC